MLNFYGADRFISVVAFFGLKLVDVFLPNFSVYYKGLLDDIFLLVDVEYYPLSFIA